MVDRLKPKPVVVNEKWNSSDWPATPSASVRAASVLLSKAADPGRLNGSLFELPLHSVVAGVVPITTWVIFRPPDCGQSITILVNFQARPVVFVRRKST